MDFPRRYVVYVGDLRKGRASHSSRSLLHGTLATHAPDLRLVLVGSGPTTTRAGRRAVRGRDGWLTEEEKRSALTEAIALVQPSHLESLSIVLMEAWLEGTPAIVASQSDVLREHCEGSGGGLAFADYEDFEAELGRLLEDSELRTSIGAAGRRYVAKTASWGVVKERFRNVTWSIVAQRVSGTTSGSRPSDG